MHTLIAEITAGELKTGDLLPRELDLAEIYGISRGVARECVRALEERGLVVVKHGSGAAVADRGDWNVLDPDVLSALLQRAGGSVLLGETLAFQRVLESEAAAVAAARATPDRCEALTAAHERLCRLHDDDASGGRGTRAVADADAAFHRAIADAADNRLVARATENVHRALAQVGDLSDARDGSIIEHENILAAIREGDPDAARAAMHRHLDSVEARLRRFTPRSAT